MSGLLSVTYTYLPGTPGVLVVRRNSDGYFYDFDDSTFDEVPTTGYVVPAEDPLNPGVYTWSIAQAWDGVYQFIWYNSAAKTSAPTVWSASLVAGVQADQFSAIEASSAAAQAASEAVQTQLETMAPGNVFTADALANVPASGLTAEQELILLNLDAPVSGASIVSTAGWDGITSITVGEGTIPDSAAVYISSAYTGGATHVIARKLAGQSAWAVDPNGNAFPCATPSHLIISMDAGADAIPHTTITLTGLTMPAGFALQNHTLHNTLQLPSVPAGSSVYGYMRADHSGLIGRGTATAGNTNLRPAAVMIAGGVASESAPGAIEAAAEAAQSAAENITLPSNLAVESSPGALEAAVLGAASGGAVVGVNISTEQE